MMMFDGDAGYVFEQDSDQEKPESSDDEIEQWLHGTPDQKRKIRRKSLGNASSSEDEFEKQMEIELTTTMKNIEATNSADIPQSSNSSKKKEDPEFYDNQYFDSDSDDEGTSQEKKERKRPMLTDDDLLYDPNMDDQDQIWVNKQRQKYQPKGDESKTQNKSKVKPLPNSDAVLNCPACMTTLCMDCQRHSLYKNQYRAMFVMNCSVDQEEILKYPANQDNYKKNRKNKKLERQTVESSGTGAEGSSQNQTSEDSVDRYHPVKCCECNTEVGVFDNEEVFHFFNVLSSYG